MSGQNAFRSPDAENRPLRSISRQSGSLRSPSAELCSPAASTDWVDRRGSCRRNRAMRLSPASSSRNHRRKAYSNPQEPCPRNTPPWEQSEHCRCSSTPPSRGGDAAGNPHSTSTLLPSKAAPRRTRRAEGTRRHNELRSRGRETRRSNAELRRQADDLRRQVPPHGTHSGNVRDRREPDRGREIHHPDTDCTGCPHSPAVEDAPELQDEISAGTANSPLCPRESGTRRPVMFEDRSSAFQFPVFFVLSI